MNRTSERVELPREVDPQPDFVKMERELLIRWYREEIVEKYLRKNERSAKKFSFLDGPITANNPMGVHHARGRTYKDLWQRYHNMKGERQRFQNGFDCQGLWVEVEVEKELGFKNKKDILVYGVEKFVNKCKERVLKYAAIQTEQSQRLGMFMDWPNSYYTMSDENNYAIWHFLAVCHQRGWIYKGRESVPWCPRCETAISQHEMLSEDYREVTHKAIYLELPIVGREREFLLVWTTTPWTIPANIAVAVDPKLSYALVKGSTGDAYWVAKAAVERIFGAESKKDIVKTEPGKGLVGLRYRGPFDDLPAVQATALEHPEKFHLVIASDPVILQVTTQEGTGLVHTAVSAGTEDFKLGKKYGLPMIPIIADNADYLAGMGWLAGKNAKKHPELILDHLVEREKNGEDWVFGIHDYTHRYPTCWRCKTELVWKVTDEWYVAMDKPWQARSMRQEAQSRKPRASRLAPRVTLREQMIDIARKINWIPQFGLERELDWLHNMNDWLISKKNRFWGLALPIYECESCGWFDVIAGKDELKKRAVEGWKRFEGHSPHKPWIDKVKISCPNCKKSVSRIEPVGNPWLDAGIVSFSTMPKGWFPADFITESFPGQFKNWFYSLLVMSTVLAGERPFKTVLGFESVVGEDGRPMHKSWGNMIEFNEGAEKVGVDIMRWMYAKSAPTTVLQFGYKMAAEIRRRLLLILWNSYRFFVGQAAADRWSPGQTTTGKRKKEHILDRWILDRLSDTVHEVSRALDRYQSAPATEAIEAFVTDFSTWYIRRSRDRVGPTVPDGEDKRAAYATLHRVLTTLSRILAPFMPYIADYIYINLTGKSSVHLASWPTMKPLTGKEKNVREKMELVRSIVEGLHSLRKKHGIPLRQPLGEWTFHSQDHHTRVSFTDLLRLIEKEVNVKEYVPFDQRGRELAKKRNVDCATIKPKHSGEMRVYLSMHITRELKREGWERQLIRSIQQMRKDEGIGLSDYIIASIPDWPEEYEKEIKRRTRSRSLERSAIPGVRKVS